MNSEIGPTQLLSPASQFAQQFGSSRRGAQRARRIATRQLATWGWPPTSDAAQTAALLVAELAANAVTHGRVPGRDFRLCLTVLPDLAFPITLRIEVSDARGEKPPTWPSIPAPTAESGRGLLLVDALATHWGTDPRHPSGKTIWAELPLPARTTDQS